MAEPTTAKLTSMHFYAWKKGLKTGMYYLRTRPKADAIQFTVDQASLLDTKNKEAAAASAKLLTATLAKPATAGAADSTDHSSVEKLAAKSLSQSADHDTTVVSGLDSVGHEDVCDSCGA